jgi:hybrid cluster-associated redox disulfide protein
MEITRETLISEIVLNCPELTPAFQAIGMHCLGCAMASNETLEEACAVHGVDVDAFIESLKDFQ